MKRILTGAAAMRREGRLQQREDRLSTKNADLKAEVERLRKELIGVVAVLSAEVDFIASLTAENERLREALETIQTSHVPDQPASRDVDPEKYIHEHHTKLRRIARAALQPKENTQ